MSFDIRHMIVTVSGIVALSTTVLAQTPSAPAFDLNLTVPDSPAFIILGASPSQIERPTTPTALGVSLLSSIKGSSNLIPANYALQVSPYWLGHPQLELREYLAPSLGQSIVQTLSFSFASVKAGDSGSSSGTSVGFGVGTSLWAGHASHEFSVKLAATRAHERQKLALRGLRNYVEGQLRNALLKYRGTTNPRTEEAYRLVVQMQDPAAFQRIIDDEFSQDFDNAQITEGDADPAALVKEKTKAKNTSLESLNAKIDELTEPTRHPFQPLVDPVTRLLLQGRQSDSDKATVDQIAFIAVSGIVADFVGALGSFVEATTAAQDADSKKLQATDKLRRGFMFGVAGAVASNIPDSAFTDAKFERWGIWATPAYRLDQTPFEVVGVFKVIHRPETEGPNLLDLGVRAVRSFENLNWSGEYLGRIERTRDSTSPKSQRMTINLEYRIREKIYLTAAFGKDFADPSAGTPKGGLISLLGVNFGFGETPSIKVAQ